MPKMKTNKSAAKRFKRAGSGAMRHARANRRHLLTKKAPKRMRQLRGSAGMIRGDAVRASRMLPYA